MRVPTSSRACSQEMRSQRPSPRSPTRFIGYRIRSGSSTWLMVAGPLAQLRPRLAGWTGLPSNFEIRPVSLSTQASRPQLASQLKHVVGTSRWARRTLVGHAFASSASTWSQVSSGG